MLSIKLAEVERFGGLSFISSNLFFGKAVALAEGNDDFELLKSCKPKIPLSTVNFFVTVEDTNTSILYLYVDKYSAK